MSQPIAQTAGTALFWKGIQYAGIKVIFFVRLLILARLLAPDDFGLLAISMVAIDVMTRITDFGLIPALVQRESSERLHYDTAWTVGLVRASLVTGIVLLVAPLVADLFNDPRATNLIRVLAFRPLFESLASIKMAELIRNLRFRDLTFIKLPEALVNTIVAVALAPTIGVWTLVAGVLAGQLAVLIISYILAPHRPRLSFNREAARSLLQFGRWIFMFSLIAVMGSSVLRLFITRELGTAELGLYYLAVSLAFLPSEVASQVVGEVTFPLYARLQSNRAQMSKVFRSMFTGVLAVLMPVCALLIALAPDLVQDVLGSKWEGTAPVIRILALASVISLLGATVVPLFHGIGKPSRVVVLEIVQTTFMLGGFWVFAPRWGLTGVAVAQLFAITTSQFFSAWFTTNLLPRPFLGFLKPLAAIIIISITGAIIAREFNILLPGWVGLFLGSGLAMIGMGWGLWASDRRLELGMVDSLALAFPQMAVFIGQLLTSNR